jgi:hypothetical protein
MFDTINNKGECKMTREQKALKDQLNYYRSLIQDAPDVETAIDVLDNVGLILATLVIDEKFGDKATYNALYNK